MIQDEMKGEREWYEAHGEHDVHIAWVHGIKVAVCVECQRFLIYPKSGEKISLDKFGAMW